MKIIGAIFGVIALLVAVSVAFDLGGLVYQKNTAEMRGTSNAEGQIESATSRIDNYEMFFSLCKSVQQKEDTIDLLEANASMDETKRDMAITANQTQRANMINEYNSASTQDYTAARFKDSDLPYRLARGPYDGQTRTTCAAQ